MNGEVEMRPKIAFLAMPVQVRRASRSTWRGWDRRVRLSAAAGAGALHGLTSGTVGRYRARDCTEGSIEFIRECRYVAGLDRLARVNKFLILQEME
jgi:hypothetical protein